MKVNRLPNRLKAWREHRELTQEKLADLVGTSHSQIQRLESGKRPLTDRWALRLAPALRCNPEDLYGSDVSPLQAPVRIIPQISWVQASDLSPEPDFLSQGDYEDVVYYPSKRESLIALHVRGTSMNRVAPEGSIIIVDYEDVELFDGRCYIFRFDGDTTFKRYRDNPPRLEPYSTDPQHEPIFVDGPVEVVGHVIHVLTQLP